MAQHLTEEEQLETLKRWWAENGRSVVIGVVVAVVGYFGWQGWQSQQQAARESASVLFEDLAATVVAQPGESLSEDQRLRAESIVEELKSDYGRLLYASNAALLMARVAVEQGDLDAAEQHLRWVVERNRSAELTLLAQLRLAQVLLGKGEYDQALRALDTAQPGAYGAAYAELRGDVLSAQNRPEEARAAYRSALESLLPAQAERRDIIQMKLDDIQGRGAKLSHDNSAAEALS